jgi:hypothetical protein
MGQFTAFAIVMLILFVKFYKERIRNRFIEIIYKAVMKLTAMQIKNTLKNSKKIVMFVKKRSRLCFPPARKSCQILRIIAHRIIPYFIELIYFTKKNID